MSRNLFLVNINKLVVALFIKIIFLKYLVNYFPNVVYSKN